MWTVGRAEGVLGYLSLLTSLSTVLCCALPSLFVLLGLGATIASVVSAAPWLIAFSLHRQVEGKNRMEIRVLPVYTSKSPNVEGNTSAPAML
jgi:hypothetical protein